MKRILFLLVLLSIIYSSCGKKKIVPKPEAYFRVTFPKHEYQKYDTDTCPFTFEYPVYADISRADDIEYHPCWLNVNFNGFNAHLHLTLREVSNNLDSLLNDSHTLVYKHTIKADAIEARDFVNDSLKIFATIYYIEGGAASPVQFHITDSTKYYLHGSLYFNLRTNADSLAPSVDFIDEDVRHFIETFQWKNINSNECF
jgi:gliding motility-associated lipoprotein GldD